MSKRRSKPLGSTAAGTSVAEPAFEGANQAKSRLPHGVDPPTPNRWFLMISAVLLTVWNMILLGMALYGG